MSSLWPGTIRRGATLWQLRSADSIEGYCVCGHVHDLDELHRSGWGDIGEPTPRASRVGRGFNGVGATGLSCELESRRVQVNRLEAQVAGSTLRVRAGQKLFQVSIVVAVRVAIGPVEAGRIVRIQTVRNLPVIGQAVSVAVQGREHTGGGTRGDPVGGVVGVAAGADALE